MHVESGVKSPLDGVPIVRSTVEALTWEKMGSFISTILVSPPSKSCMVLRKQDDVPVKDFSSALWSNNSHPEGHSLSDVL